MTSVSVKDKIEFIVALVSDFAKKYSLSTTQAFNYLDRFNAISHLDQHYNIAHTLSFSEIIDDLLCIAKITEENFDVLIMVQIRTWPAELVGSFPTG